ncbi:MAG: peptide chain release factor 1 [Lachnospiraceae bacterium]|nr:peptide chain release factor 1 [Ruminococcus sp.]MCM1274131.1 peptide chain release factor 1 [Lachnospiraceae bacterium]
MFDKIGMALARYDEISAKLSDPRTVSDNKLYTELMREYKSLTPLTDMYKRYLKAQSDYEDARSALEDSGLDAEFREMAEGEMLSAKNETEKCKEELKILLLPRDPDDDKSVIVEIRAGAGGEEAALFAGSMFRMYSMFAARQGWKIDVMSSNPTELGGYREISFGVEGEGVYAKLKYESGVHRVQRVPETESQGRIQTSTVTVAVLPEVEEVDVNINPADLTIQTFRSSGAGGQHINKTESAVRIIHNPSGFVVECQEERSQMKNKEKAMKMLYSRLYEAEKTARDSAIAEERRVQVGTGDRSERIRTYNFPQSRVTDHRIGLTLYKLDDMMNGGCDEVFEALRVADYSARLLKQE